MLRHSLLDNKKPEGYCLAHVAKLVPLLVKPSPEQSHRLHGVTTPGARQVENQTNPDFP